MRRQGFKASSAQGVCVFCACRLGGEALHTSARGAQYLQRRGLQSSRQLLQSYDDAEAQRQALRAMFPQESPQPSAQQPKRPAAQSSQRPQQSSVSTKRFDPQVERERQALQHYSKRAQPQAQREPQHTQPSNGDRGFTIRYSGQRSEKREELGSRYSSSRGEYRIRFHSSEALFPIEGDSRETGFDQSMNSKWSHLPRRGTGQSTGEQSGEEQSSGATQRWAQDFKAKGRQGDRNQFVAFNPEIHDRGQRSIFRPGFARPQAIPKEDVTASAAARAKVSEPLLGEESPNSQSKEASSVEASEETQERLPRRSKKFAVDDDLEQDYQKNKKGKRSHRRSEYDEEEDFAQDRAERKARKKKERQMRVAEKATAPTPIHLPEYISVVNLAHMLKVRTEDFVRKMEELGFEDIHNDDILNAENAGLVAMEYNFEPVAASPDEDLDLHPAPEPEDMSILPQRPPVVTIMGHVDHGKTTLLDYLRKSSVAASEFGGITQHIGAFSVPLSSGKTITFLDTPGHAAFLTMRQRGANVTDIVILVVAADDSVKPQTIEAINHAKAARVPIIVAINKIDKEGASPDRVKQDLARHGVDVEDYGGDVQAINVSGKTGQGIEELEEAVSTLSEILDHRADPDGNVEGHVLEASVKKSGRVATLLIKRGTLRIGDIIVAGKTFARVRTMRNEAGALINDVGPGMPAEVDGWRGKPDAGDQVLQAPDEQRASDVVDYRNALGESEKLAKDMEAINETRRLENARREKEAAAAAAAEAAGAAGKDDTATNEADREAIVAEEEDATPSVIEVPFILKADVSGSTEAVMDYVMTVGNSEVRPTVLRAGVGAVSEFDVEHAAVAQGHIISFNTTVDPKIAHMAEMKGVKVLENNVIYRLVDQVKEVLSEKLAPSVIQRVTGEATVLQTFSIGLGGKKTMMVAGCKVQNGVVTRGSKVRVMRGEKKIYDGTLSTLKQVKKDVSEMRKGSECGMSFESWRDFQAGDMIQCYEERFEKRYL